MDIRKDGRRVRSMLGVVPQDIALYEELTGRENLHFWGGLYGLAGKRLREEADRVLELVGLTDRADDPVREYSGGMKRRLNLSAGLIHRPKVILLDEPTLGIDPQARLNILDIIRNGVSGGMTAIYTTHYLEEAEKLCDRIAIIDHGKILAQGTLGELVKLAGEGNLVTVTRRLHARAGEPAPQGDRRRASRERLAADAGPRPGGAERRARDGSSPRGYRSKRFRYRSRASRAFSSSSRGRSCATSAAV